MAVRMTRSVSRVALAAFRKECRGEYACDSLDQRRHEHEGEMGVFRVNAASVDALEDCGALLRQGDACGGDS